jgi:hypothetical protein
MSESAGIDSFFGASDAETRGLLSDEHFSVGGTQIAAWASMKSFRRRRARAGAVHSNAPPRP